MEKKPALRFARHDFQGLINGPQHRRRQGRGINERPGPVVQVLHQAAVPGHIASLGAQGLGKRAHVNIHFPGETQGCGQARARLSQDPGGMGLVDHQPGPVTGLQGYEVGQRGHVAIHRKDRVRDDQPPPGAPGLLQQLLQAVHIPVGEALQRCAGQLDAVINAGVIEPVAENHIPRPHQGSNGAHIGHVAGGKNHRGLSPLERGQAGLHGLMQAQVAHHQAGGAGPGAPLGRGRPGCVDEPGVLGQPQIIVGR